MENDNLKYISAYYDTLVNKFGHAPEACDYGHSASQKIKFSVLSSCIDHNGKSVLDIGCGFADYAGFLEAKYKNIKYTGVDISQEMIAMAKKLRPGLQLEVRNVFANPLRDQYDVVTANGIFYLLGDNAFELMKEFVQKMFNMASGVLAFNSLSSWTEDKHENEYYADPLEVIDFCKTLSPWVTLRHDYHHRDFTVFVYKQRNI